MLIGVPRETHRHEHRAGLTPSAAVRLVKEGHSVFVESGAGIDAHFEDHHYEAAGARIVYDREEIYRRADLVCQIGALTPEELDLLRSGSIVCGFHHLAVASQQVIERLQELETTLIGFEIIRDAAGELPVLVPFSEMAGRLAVQLAAHCLQNEEGGRGVLLGNVPGVAPPTVLVLGAGTAGSAAAAQAIAAGAHVIAIDHDLSKLRQLNAQLEGRSLTTVGGLARLENYTAIADVVIGAVLVPGSRAPTLVSEEMVKAMKPGSVVVDLSIDQGGCFETSRPTDLAKPTFRLHDTVHYCVPNLTANIARTATRAFANAWLPYLLQLADRGLDRALEEDPGLAAGIYLYRGQNDRKERDAP